MSLELISAGLRGIAALTTFVQDAPAFFAEQKDAIEQLKSLGLAVRWLAPCSRNSCRTLLRVDQVSDAKSAYVANRELCLKLGSRVGLLSGTLDALRKHMSSAQGHGHLKALQSAVQEAQVSLAVGRACWLVSSPFDPRLHLFRR